MSKGMAQTKTEEVRGRAVGGRAPVEVITEAKDLLGKEIDETKPVSLADALTQFLVPTMTFIDLQGRYRDQEFAPPDPGVFGAVDPRIMLASVYGQSPYSDLTWLSAPLMLPVGLASGVYKARKKAKGDADAFANALGEIMKTYESELGKKDEQLQKMAEALKQYAQQTQTPGQRPPAPHLGEKADEQMDGSYSAEFAKQIRELKAMTYVHDAFIRRYGSDVEREKLLPSIRAEKTIGVSG